MDSYAYSHSCPGYPGDLIVFRRPVGYIHYAVNVGNGYIVHVTTPDGIASTSSNAARSSIGFCCSTNSLGPIAVVKKEPFAKFVKPGDRVKVENAGTWRGKTALQRMEIVRRALSKIGEEGYNLLFKNCEHFARWCRYGEEESEQATNLGGLGVLAGAAVVGVLGYGAYRLLSDSEAEKEKKPKILKMSRDCPGEPGDLVVFIRKKGAYRHYTVNVGNGYIIHATSVSDERVGIGDVLGCCSASSNIAMIKKEKYSDFVKPGDEVKVENGTWRGRTPLPVKEIIARAHKELGKRDYSVLWNNCEHFARSCRYGEEKSDQADGLLSVGAVAAAGAVALGLYAWNQSSKNKNKSQ